MLSLFSHVPLFATLWTIAHQLLYTREFPGSYTGVGCQALLQGIFLTQESNTSLLHLLHWQGSLPHAPPEMPLYDIISYIKYTVLSHSVVSDSATTWTEACWVPLSMEILQGRILEWDAMPSSRGSSQPRDRIQVSPITGRFCKVWATRGVQHLIAIMWNYTHTHTHTHTCMLCII